MIEYNCKKERELIKMKNDKLVKVQNRINELEKLLWGIQMIDHWTSEDREYFSKYNNELKELKKLIVEKVLED